MNYINIEQAKLILDEEDILAGLCNITAFLNEITDDINWIGFYFYRNDELIIGPFQGRVACSHLSLNKGVCAHAFNNKTITNIADVHNFKTHIACDSRTNSELVIPIIIDDKCIGVLDIDSISFNRFTKDDELFFKEITDLIANFIKTH